MKLVLRGLECEIHTDLVVSQADAICVDADNPGVGQSMDISVHRLDVAPNAPRNFADRQPVRSGQRAEDLQRFWCRWRVSARRSSGSGRGNPLPVPVRIFRQACSPSRSSAARCAPATISSMSRAVSARYSDNAL